MKMLLLSVLLCSTAYAQVSKVNIQNFNFNYRVPAGTGTADAFSYEKNLTPTQQVSVEKIGEVFKIVLAGVENQEIDFKGAPDLMLKAETIELGAFNLSFAERFSLSFSNALFDGADDHMNLNNFSLICDRSLAFPQVMDQVITGCIQKMDFKTGSLSTQGEGFDQALMRGFDESHDEFKSSMTVKNVDFRVNGGKFDLSAEIKAQISGKAKGNGTIQYDASAKKITVKISSVKFGILDVTSKVFDELKKQESETVKVNKPFVYITIK